MTLLHEDQPVMYVRNVGVVAGQQILNHALVIADGPVPFARAPRQPPRDRWDWHLIVVHLSTGQRRYRPHRSDDLLHFMPRHRNRIEGVVRRWRQEDDDETIWESYDLALDDLGLKWGQEHWLPKAWLAEQSLPWTTEIVTHIYGSPADWVVRSYGHALCFDSSHPRICTGARHGVEPYGDDAA